jgi:hypothetical protein
MLVFRNGVMCQNKTEAKVLITLFHGLEGLNLIFFSLEGIFYLLVHSLGFERDLNLVTLFISL